MPDKNRPDVSSGARILPGRFGSKDNPQAPTAPTAPATPASLSGPSPAPDPKRVMADTRDSLSHRPPTHVEVCAELVRFDEKTKLTSFRINALNRRIVFFEPEELPPRIQWAVQMNRRYYRVAVNMQSKMHSDLQAMDWSVVEAQREMRRLRGL